MTDPEQLCPYGTDRRSRRSSIARGIAILVGVGIGFFGVALFVLRCFSTCPSDPAENAISQILTLSLVGFGVVVIVAASTLGTRWAAAGASTVMVLGALMAIAAVVALVLAPSLRLPGDRSGAFVLALIDTAVGASVMLFGTRVRERAGHTHTGH